MIQSMLEGDLMTDREALAAAVEYWVSDSTMDPFDNEPQDKLDLLITAARERLAQLEDSEGRRLHGLIREWNPDLNDYAVIQFAKQVMDTIGGTE